jgi:hypothetical protein
MRVLITIAIAACVLHGLAACGGGSESRRGGEAGAEGRSRSMAGATTNDQGRCSTEDPNHEISEYDTSGDEYPDVRKVFRRMGDPRSIRLVLVCREADLNADGVKDVVRYYNDEGRPLREESDRDFDGQMDELVFFEDGRVIRVEQDMNGDGRVDTKIFYEDGRPLRAERDVAGRSSPQAWRPDRWEYYENGRVIRVGTDLDGDGSVDRWDRDEEYRREQEARELREAAQRAREEQDAADRGEEPPPEDT